ncbi:MAG: FmdB family zinc ribbon protein [Planctomycetaceae bacterium]
MPTYDYICKECGHRWELFQSIKASPVRKCPDCGRLKAKREIGAGAGIIFKGSGFYQTDYRSKAYKKAADADTRKAESTKTPSDSKPSGDSTTGKTESKAE